jgi:hypothetical protein
MHSGAKKLQNPKVSDTKGENPQSIVEDFPPDGIPVPVHPDIQPQGIVIEAVIDA